MPSSLGNPWLIEYIISVVSTYPDCTTQPLCSNKRKVQILKFLTYGVHANDDCIWAIISDGNACIPAKFTKQALDDYTALANGRRFTQNKEWQLTICKYQLTFRRTPTGSTTSRMNPHSSLVLEVNGIYNAPGSVGPSDASSVESNAYPAVLEWVEALRRGEGSLLRDRDRALGNGPPESSRQAIKREASLHTPLNRAPTPPSGGARTSRSSLPVKKVDSRAPKLGSQTSTLSDEKSRGVSPVTGPRQAYDSKWSWIKAIRHSLNRTDATRQGLAAIHDVHLIHEDDEDAAQEQSTRPVSPACEGPVEEAEWANTPPTSQRQTTPDAWEATQPPESDGPELVPDDEPEDRSLDTVLSPRPTSPVADPFSSPLRSVPATQYPAQPTPSLSAVRTPDTDSIARHHAGLDRQVPPPLAPASPLANQSLNPRDGNVLVENSDVSMSQSQSQPRLRDSALSQMPIQEHRPVDSADERGSYSIPSQPPRPDTHASSSTSRIPARISVGSVPVAAAAMGSDTEDDSPVAPVKSSHQRTTITTDNMRRYQPATATRQTSGSSAISRKSSSGQSASSRHHDTPLTSPIVPLLPDVFTDAATLGNNDLLRNIKSLAPAPAASTSARSHTDKHSVNSGRDVPVTTVSDADEGPVRRRVKAKRFSRTRESFAGTARDSPSDSTRKDPSVNRSRSPSIAHDDTAPAIPEHQNMSHDDASNRANRSATTEIRPSVPTSRPSVMTSVPASEDLVHSSDRRASVHRRPASVTPSITSIASTSSRSRTSSTLTAAVPILLNEITTGKRGSLLITKENGARFRISDASGPPTKAARLAIKRPRSSESLEVGQMEESDIRLPTKKKARHETPAPPHMQAGPSSLRTERSGSVAQSAREVSSPAPGRRNRLKGWRPDLNLPSHVPLEAISWDRLQDAALQALRWRHQLLPKS